ncbi:MAG TPA: cation transporter [Terriglobales bacterium]|nr:cation transporter [Terriglobales bacterium]
MRKNDPAHGDVSPISSVALLRRGLWVEYVSLAWMMVEAFASIYSGLLAWSFALLAFGGDSLVELLSSLIVVIHMRAILGGKSHAHIESGRAEWATALLLLSLLPVIGVGVGYSLLAGVRPESSLLGMAVAIGAVLIMPILWHQKKEIGTKTNCLPLTIDSAESATCLLMSLALLIGLVINYVLRLFWVDYVITAIILVFVAREASEAISEVRATD